MLGIYQDKEKKKRKKEKKKRKEGEMTFSTIIEKP
jgi:hypothetical protein